ncbi:MAG: hypothetical protein IJ689_07980 [Alphaproteobacteria bacterium]|nr:hypothetical protein [Alphaproteobacteria bacterium]
MQKLMTAFLILLMGCETSLAGVRSIVDSASHTKRERLNSNYISSSVKKCTGSGYTRTSCYGNEYGVDVCPYDIRYFKYCCPPQYTSTQKECREQGMVASGSSCHGYYECRPIENEDTRKSEDFDY